jgi:hypothetical protein
MTYTKPEIAILGEATRVVQGEKDKSGETITPVTGPGAFELED